MKKKWKILAILLLALLAAGSGVAYLLIAKPFAAPVLVTVNGEKIPPARFQEELAKLEPVYQDMFKADPSKLLDGIIIQTLFLQEAKKEGIPLPKAGSAPGEAGDDGKQATVRAFLEKRMAALPPLDPKQIDQIYDAYKDQFKGQKKEEILPFIAQMLEQQRQSALLQKLIADLRQKARVEIDQKQYQKLVAQAKAGSEPETQSEADLRKALAGGKPLVVDFGSDSCLPCRQLRPILKSIRKSYAGKVEVLIIDIRQQEKLAGDYKIQVIPTVVFFDAKGREVHRSQGFMSEDQIKEQLTRMGIA